MLSYEERYEYETPELMAEYSWGTQLGWEKSREIQLSAGNTVPALIFPY